MIVDVIKHALPMLHGGKHHVFPTLAELVFGPDGEPLVKDGKWNLPVPDGVVPDTRTINGHALDRDVELDAEDVSARPSDWTPSLEDVGGTWKAGDTFTFSGFFILMGWAYSTTQAWFTMNVGKPITATSASITELKVNRLSQEGVNGISTETQLVGLSGYKLEARIHSSGNVTVTVNFPASLGIKNICPTLLGVLSLKIKFA